MGEVDFNVDQVRRAVVQQLEGLRRAGVTHWKHVDPQVAVSSVPLAVESSLHSVPVVASPSTPLVPAKSTILVEQKVAVKQPNLAELSVESVSPEASSKRGSVKTASPVVRSLIQPMNLPLAERISGLAILREQVKCCTRCPELVSTRTQTVFGVGNPEAKIVFVGEAPGADEDAQGEPFVGKSGQLLNDIIKACRLRREDLYICNVLRCRPPGNRLPAPDECANCREYLDGQIAHVNPEYIVCWGACAAQNVLSSTETIGKLRGRFFTYGNAKVICTYHPSYLMRNPAAKKDVWEDMKMLFLNMGIDLTKKV